MVGYSDENELGKLDNGIQSWTLVYYTYLNKNVFKIVLGWTVKKTRVEVVIKK